MRKKKNKQLIKLILAKSKEICKSISKSQNTKRGRPKVYEDYIIISALLIKTKVPVYGSCGAPFVLPFCRGVFMSVQNQTFGIF
ncbi:hypothetical protein Hydth_1215 [Hydrogenobacter thermophilus TK-6]|uniref:Uncharacterized protein n=1 Tax=Hydrogenobacter thermophilus (strain DSM 6534 / IAM 12695 / TK-6) TaxID=608538 RepID=D3DIM5_HYDTT|nr:hypothetical protein Hydth_1215 [Hydrogenobacter thermophilus TK-6]BAI69677.1 hypothetical protein HTH_1223 [Hydrogenobacter thermophilus TK-6]